MDKAKILENESGTLDGLTELGYLATRDHLAISGWSQKRKVNPLNFEGLFVTAA